MRKVVNFATQKRQVDFFSLSLERGNKLQHDNVIQITAVVLCKCEVQWLYSGMFYVEVLIPEVLLWYVLWLSHKLLTILEYRYSLEYSAT